MVGTLTGVINSAGVWLLDWTWPMLWQSSIVIAVVFMLDRLLRRQARARVRYALWMLVLVKLVLPPSLALPSGMGYWIERPKQVQAAEPAVWAMPAIVYDPILKTDYDAKPVESKRIQLKEMVRSEPDRVGIPLTSEGLAFIGWMAGMLALSILALRRVLYVRQVVARAVDGPERLQAVLDRIAGEMGVRGAVRLRLTPEVVSPAVCGLMRPVVLVPSGLLWRLSSDRLRTVLMHELAHIRRGDVLINACQTVLIVVYFYNPLVWAVHEMIRRVRENAVDETVLAGLGRQAVSYGDTLLEVAEMAFAQRIAGLGLMGGVESRRLLASRIRHIAERGAPKCAKCGWMALAAVILLGMALLPMACAADKEPGFTVKGHVLDARTREPVAGARVSDGMYADGRYGAVTDSKGFYSYKTYYEEHNIECTAPEYKDNEKTLLTKVMGREKERVMDFLMARERGAIVSAGDSESAGSVIVPGRARRSVVARSGDPNSTAHVTLPDRFYRKVIVHSDDANSSAHVMAAKRMEEYAHELKKGAKVNVALEIDEEALTEMMEAKKEMMEAYRGQLAELEEGYKEYLEQLKEHSDELAEAVKEWAEISKGKALNSEQLREYLNEVMRQKDELIKRAGDMAALTEDKKFLSEGMKAQMSALQRYTDSLQKSRREVPVTDVNVAELKSQFDRVSGLVGEYISKEAPEGASRKIVSWQMASDANGLITVKCRYETAEGDGNKVLRCGVLTFDNDGNMNAVKKGGDLE